MNVLWILLQKTFTAQLNVRNVQTNAQRTIKTVLLNVVSVLQECLLLVTSLVNRAHLGTINPNKNKMPVKVARWGHTKANQVVHIVKSVILVFTATPRQQQNVSSVKLDDTMTLKVKKTAANCVLGKTQKYGMMVVTIPKTEQLVKANV